MEAGADAVGFVLTPSSRQVSLADAGILMGLVPKDVLGVAVFHDPTPGLLALTESEVAPDMFQAELDSLTGLARDRILPVVVAGDAMATELDRALEASGRGIVLVDSAARGGTGQAADWDRLAGTRRRDRMILAGGLDPMNVGEAVSKVGPFGVDVSSGIESSPGVKDPSLMIEFVKAARASRPSGPGTTSEVAADFANSEKRR